MAQSIKADKAIERLDEVVRIIDCRIEKMKLRQQFWLKFLSSLSVSDRQYFTNKYLKKHVCLNERLDHLAMEEIAEINLAIAMCYCTRNEKREEVSSIELVKNDYAGNLDKLLDTLDEVADV